MGNENVPQRLRFAPARTCSATAVLAVHGVLVFGLLAALTIVVPRFEVMFREARMTPPRMTQSAIALSNFCKSQFGVAGALAVGILYGDWMLYRWLRRHRESPADSRTWSVLVALALIGCGLWLVVALFMPLLGPLQSIGS